MVEKSTSLDWFDYLRFRVITKSNETMSSLEDQDMDYILKLNEYLDITDYVTETSHKEEERKHEAQKSGTPFR